jgi:hypothetical protein
MKSSQPLPQALKENLIIHELDGETLVYDQESAHAYCLNHSSAFVWRYCDGKTTAGQVARLLQRELDTPVKTDVVLLALKQLQRNGLVERSTNTPQISRRDLVLKYAPAAALALPLVVSIVAPEPAQAASCAMGGETCGPPPCCPGFNCDGICFAT